MTATEPYLPRERIEHDAQRVLQRWGMSTLPVDPLAIAHRERIGVYTVQFVDATLSGAISVDAVGVATIQISRDDPPTRKRFTIAHELGHYFLHLSPDSPAVDGAIARPRQFTDGTNNLFRQPGKARHLASDEARREYQANLFAAALLMPEAQVRTFWQSYDSVWDMSRVFEVSDSAMSIRLGQLGLLDE